MKYLSTCLIIALLFFVGVFGLHTGVEAAQSYFNASQLSTTTTPGYVFQSNGPNAPGSFVATSTLGFSGGVSSVFGRTGAVVATLGDYTTSLVTEGTNLYFTNARAIASTLTGFSATTGTVSSSDSILTALEKLAGNAATYLTNITGLITNGTGIGLSGSGTSGSPYSISNTGVTSIVAGTNITVSGATGAVTINASGGGSTFAYPFTPTANYNSTSTVLGFLNGSGIFTTGSSTIASTTFLANGNVGIGTTTPGSLLSIGNTGWNFYDNATSTDSGAGGVNIQAGCFAIKGVCVGGGGGGSGTVTSITATSPLTGGTITTTGSIGIQAASASQNGYLSLSDYSLLHTATTTFSSPLIYTGSTNAVTCQVASGSQAGCLSSTDWNTFNGKGSGSVTSIATNASLTGGTITTTGTLALNLNNPNYWTSLQNFTVASTSELTATSTVWLTGIGGAGFVQADANGKLSSAAITSGQVTTALGFTPYNNTNPSNYIALTALSGVYPIVDTSGAFSLAFGTTTANSWSALQQFNGNASTTGFTDSGKEWLTALGTPAGSFLAVDPNGKVIATTTPAGGVTSVAQTVPSFLSISGSPITTSGTLAIGYSGTALPIANGGTGLTAVGASSTVLTTDGAVTIWQKLAFAAMSGLLNLANQVTGVLGIANGGTATSTIGAAGKGLVSDGTNYEFQTIPPNPVGYIATSSAGAADEFLPFSVPANNQILVWTACYAGSQHSSNGATLNYRWGNANATSTADATPYAGGASGSTLQTLFTIIGATTTAATITLDSSCANGDQQNRIMAETI